MIRRATKCTRTAELVTYTMRCRSLRDGAGALRRRQRAGGRRVIARAWPGLQVSHGDQAVVGVGHGVLGHAMLDGASPHRWQALPRLERAAGNQAGDLFHDSAHATHGGSCGVDCASFRSEEHTSELQSLMRISYAVFCL